MSQKSKHMCIIMIFGRKCHAFDVNGCLECCDSWRHSDIFCIWPVDWFDVRFRNVAFRFWHFAIVSHIPCKQLGHQAVGPRVHHHPLRSSSTLLQKDSRVSYKALGLTLAVEIWWACRRWLFLDVTFLKTFWQMRQLTGALIWWTVLKCRRALLSLHNFVPHSKQATRPSGCCAKYLFQSSWAGKNQGCVSRLKSVAFIYFGHFRHFCWGWQWKFDEFFEDGCFSSWHFWSFSGKFCIAPVHWSDEQFESVFEHW